MSQYLVISHIEIQNANSIAGLTWGFPAISNFLGFTHALSRKISSGHGGQYETIFTGCAVVSHTIHNKVYQPKKFADYRFLQSKNPPVLKKHKKGSPPIIEEGKMNLTVSLVIELSQSLMLTSDEIEQFEQAILTLCYRMRIAGGIVLNIKRAKLLSASTKEQEKEMLRKIKRLTMPGFVLLDRSTYLKEHYQNLLTKFEQQGIGDKPQLLDAWLDFSALKYKAIPKLAGGAFDPDEKTPADWQSVAKPFSGYLVPIMTGYKAISELYKAGEVLNTRDETTPSRFVEAIHSVGEWKGLHGVEVVDHIIWRYKHDGHWYLCKQNTDQIIAEEENSSSDIEQTQTLNMNEAFNLF